jgi:hypothetical protein
MRNLRIAFVVALVCLAALFTGNLFAQGTDLGTIRGTVTDATGAVVPNAKVVITDLATNGSRQQTTNTVGSFEAFGLNPGNYKVTVSSPGFSTQEITGVVVRGSDTVTANAVLGISHAAESVVVTAEAPVINTDDPTISQTMNNRDVIDLPRDSRDVYDFLYLNPNITQGDEPGDFKFIGAQSYGAAFTLDGQRSNGGIFGAQTSSQPSLEAVGEINILSNDFSAEYAGIGNIRIQTKRGTSDYHGSIFYENKNSALAAWTIQDKIGQANFAPTAFESQYPNPFFNINDLGAAFGGPVPKVKNTWFYTAFERDWTAEPQALQSTTLPHPSLWSGNFSLINDANKPAVPGNITLTPQEIAADTVGGLGQQFTQIPQRLLNPYVQKMIQLYFPQIGLSAPINPANGRVPDYQNIAGGLGIQNLGTIRVDHDFSESDHFFSVYNASSLGSNDAGFVQAPYSGLGLRQLDRENHTLSNSWVHVLRPNLINEARGGFNIQHLFEHSNTTAQGFLSSLGMTSDQISSYGQVVGEPQLSTYGHLAVNFSNTFATFANGGRNTNRPLDQNLQTFGDTLTWVVGRHNLRMGGDVVRNQALDGFALNRGNVRGLLTYSGKGLTPFTNFLLGEAPTSVSSVFEARPAMDVHNWENGYFVQDDFKITPKLTLNMGFRYELDTPFIEANDLMVNFDPNYVNTSTGQLGRFIIPSQKTLQFVEPAIINYGYVTADKSGLGIGRGLVRPDKTRFGPRFGFAWALTDKSVLRGGWGMYYPTSAAQGIRDPLASNGFNQAATKRTVAGGPALTGWPTSSSDPFSPLSGGTVAGFSNSPNVNLVPFNLQDPRVQQYNVTFEQQVGWHSSIRVSYLGTWMSGLIQGRDLNMIAPNNTPFGTTTGDGVTICDPINNGDCDYSAADRSRFRYPALGDYLLEYGNTAWGRSNSFQTEFDHRFENGLSLVASYTYLSQNATVSDTGNSSLGSVAYNPFSPASDFGQDAYLSHHRFVAYGVYDLPVGRGRKFGSSMNKLVDAVVGGWQTSFNMFIKSGTYFTPFWICDNCDPVVPGNVASGAIDAVGDFTEPSFRPVVVNKNYNQRNGDQIWNPDAFGPPPVDASLYSGNIAVHNLLEGPGAWGLNLGVHKSFKFGERVTAMLGADANNLFNHPMFLPDANYAGGGGPFALLGDFNQGVDQATGKLLPITDITPNPLFGRVETTFPQEGIDSRRTIRLRLRITF